MGKRNALNAITENKKEELVFDQHYMIDQNVISAIINAGAFKTSDTVVEIGPGKGALTKHLAGKVKKLIVIDIDPKHLKELSSLTNTEIIIGDALTVLPTLDLPTSFKLISNLPYSLCEPLFLRLPRLSPSRCIFTTGRNFYDILFDPSTKLSTIAHSSFTIRHLLDILPESFSPPPRVISCTFILDKKESPDPEEHLLASIFKQHDKKLKNAIIKTFRDELSYTNKEAKEKEALLGLNTVEEEGTVAKLSNDSCRKLVDLIKKESEKKENKN